MTKEEFWQQIKSEREEKGISLETISENTKIGIQILENIEEGNFEELSETYMRLFIKAYARETGNDFQTLLDNTPYSRVRDIHKIYSEKKIADHSGSNKDIVDNSGFSSRTRPLYIFITVMILLFVIYIGKQVMPDAVPDEQQTIIDTFEVNDQSVPVIDKDPDKLSNGGEINAPSPSVPDSIQLPVTVTLFPGDNIIYRLIVEGDIPREEMLQKDVEHSFSVDTSFTLTVYKAASCQVNLNNVVLPPAKNDQLRINVDQNGQLSLN